MAWGVVLTTTVAAVGSAVFLKLSGRAAG